jgi:hypothetical protein
VKLVYGAQDNPIPADDPRGERRSPYGGLMVLGIGIGISGDRGKNSDAGGRDEPGSRMEWE